MDELGKEKPPTSTGVMNPFMGCKSHAEDDCRYRIPVPRTQRVIYNVMSI